MQSSCSLACRIIFQICTILLILNRFPKLILANWCTAYHLVSLSDLYRYGNTGIFCPRFGAQLNRIAQRQGCEQVPLLTVETNNDVTGQKVDFKEICLIESWVVSIFVLPTFPGHRCSVSWVVLSAWKSSEVETSDLVVLLLCLMQCFHSGLVFLAKMVHFKSVGLLDPNLAHQRLSTVSIYQLKCLLTPRGSNHASLYVVDMWFWACCFSSLWLNFPPGRWW